jgi:N-acetylneuraminic acid mutarotase
MSKTRRSTLPAYFLLCASAFISSCGGGGGGGGGGAPPTPRFSIGGSISGLTADGLTLVNNGQDSISPGSGVTSFEFPTKLESGSKYAVTITATPPSLICTISNAAGTVTGASPNALSVTCMTREWTWKGGSNAINSQPEYGTQGVASATNTPNGRHDVASWVDSAGRFWLFGGEAGGINGNAGVSYPNDLWTYDPSTSQWTWMNCLTPGSIPIYGTQGVASTANCPGGRHWASSWVDKTGDFWLFGGIGYDDSGSWGLLNDLWRYQPMTNEWTWMSGSSAAYALSVYGVLGSASSAAAPGAREFAVTWTDSDGNLWLYGGFGDQPSGQSRGLLAEIWRYSPILSEWTLVSGDGTVDDPSVYGTQGVASTSNTPGGRAVDSVWQSSNGDIWMFGGECLQGYCNDLWKYSPAAATWTWISGSNGPGGQNAYGTLGIDSASNAPGARTMSSSWIDSRGNLWLFGGYGYDPSLNLQVYNDLWEFRASTNHWVWISGNSSPDSPGTYGTLGAAGLTNTPGARIKPASWKDADDNLWMFGGSGYDSTGALGFLNDIWSIQSN